VWPQELLANEVVVWLVMKEDQDRARKAYAKADAQRQQTASEQKAARRAEIRREISEGVGLNSHEGKSAL